MRIILNNLLASAMVILFGFFFGLVPLYFLVSNGLLLGYVAANRSEGETIFHLLVGILPHGIESNTKLCCVLLLKHLIPMLALIAGLMLLAAIIESTVTYALLKIILMSKHKFSLICTYQ